MYVYTAWCIMRRMTRTQIHLGEEEVAILDREQQRTGASRSELIRRAVRAAYASAPTGAPRARSIGAVNLPGLDASDDESWLAADWGRR